MRVRCLHGYFIFQEMRPEQIADFTQRTGLTLASVDDYYTFDFIKEAPEFSLLGKPIFGVPAIKTFEGKPWEVFEQNKLVYDFTKGLVVPILSIVRPVTISQSGNKFVSSGLIQPGSLTAGGNRVTDYSAWFSRDKLSWNYSEVTYG